MQFIFNHNTNALLPFLTETGQHIQQILPAAQNTTDLLHRCNYIITELCTNAIKHSGVKESLFDIYVDDNLLIIKRLGSGLPFYAKTANSEQLLIPQAITGTVTLTQDNINKLCVQRIDEYSVRFYVEDTGTENLQGQQTMGEHFGLIIICRASDSFTYTRQPDALNIFTVSLKID